VNESLARYHRTLGGVTDVVGRMPGDRWSSPSPCPGWTALHVLGHLVDCQDQVASLVTGRGRRAPADDPLTAVTGEPVAAWAAAARRVREVLAAVDPAAVVPSPLGEVPVAQVLDVVVVEPLVHAWDLARAGGLEVALDPGAVAHCLAVATPMAEQLAASGMYAPAVPVPSDASAQDRLVALLGRRPAAPLA
jgi:uncharacterized protein (TIGR03086 family)